MSTTAYKQDNCAGAWLFWDESYWLKQLAITYPVPLFIFTCYAEMPKPPINSIILISFRNTFADFFRQRPRWQIYAIVMSGHSISTQTIFL